MLRFVARLLIARQHDLCQPAFEAATIRARYRAKLRTDFAKGGTI